MSTQDQPVLPKHKPVETLVNVFADMSVSQPDATTVTPAEVPKSESVSELEQSYEQTQQGQVNSVITARDSRQRKISQKHPPSKQVDQLIAMPQRATLHSVIGCYPLSLDFVSVSNRIARSGHVLLLMKVSRAVANKTRSVTAETTAESQQEQASDSQIVVVFIQEKNGKYGMPGGKSKLAVDVLPNGEYSHLMTAIREMREEAKIDVREVQFASIFCRNQYHIPMYVFVHNTPTFLARLPDNTDLQPIRQRIQTARLDESLPSDEREILNIDAFDLDGHSLTVPAGATESSKQVRWFSATALTNLKACDGVKYLFPEMN